MLVCVCWSHGGVALPWWSLGFRRTFLGELPLFSCPIPFVPERAGSGSLQDASPGVSRHAGLPLVMSMTLLRLDGEGRKTTVNRAQADWTSVSL